MGKTGKRVVQKTVHERRRILPLSHILTHHSPKPPNQTVNKATGQVDDHNTDILMKQATLKKVIEACKKVHVCPHCGACNGVVKKVTGLSTLKIVHDPYTGAKAFDKSKEELMMLMAKASAANKDLQSLLTDENKFKQVRNWKVAAPTRRHNMLTNALPPPPLSSS